MRRNIDTGELAYYRCYAPDPVPLRELVRVAGRRWVIEESFQAGNGLAGLDEHQVRNWTSWYRWTLLAMAAHALLAVLAAAHTLPAHRSAVSWPASRPLPPSSSPPSWPGRTGGDAISTAPEPATTNEAGTSPINLRL